MQIMTHHVVEAGAAVAASGTSFVAASDQLVTIAAAVIAAISAITVAVINAWAIARIKAMDTKVSGIATKTDVIEGHVNSEKTRNMAMIASQEVQMGMLRDTIARMDITARLLAQQAASTATPTVVAIAPGVLAAPVTTAPPVVEATLDDGEGELTLTTKFTADKEVKNHVVKHGDKTGDK